MDFDELMQDPEILNILRKDAGRYKDELAVKHGREALLFGQATLGIRSALGTLAREGASELLLDRAVEALTQIAALLPPEVVSEGLICAAELSAYAHRRTEALAGSKQTASDFLAQLKAKVR